MDKINTITSRCVMLPLDNVDTDQIIPARFLKATSRNGFKDALFADWQSDANFCLNKNRGTILVAGSNFGCGSSREHAVWAIYDYGFRAVVATSFSDIFYSNALNNGLLAIKISAQFLEFLKDNSTAEISINLYAQTVEIAGKIENFDIDKYKKNCLLNGFDDIDYLVSIKDEIIDYEIRNSVTAG